MWPTEISGGMYEFNHSKKRELDPFCCVDMEVTLPSPGYTL